MGKRNFKKMEEIKKKLLKLKSKAEREFKDEKDWSKIPDKGRKRHYISMVYFYFKKYLKEEGK